MNNFSSIFEILVGVNFAFVISNHFVSQINEKIVNIVKVVNEIYEENASKIIADINFYIKNIEQIDTLNDTQRVGCIKWLVNKKNNIEFELKKTEEEKNEHIEKISTTTIFNHYSLFSALYSLTILILIGLNNEQFFNSIQFFNYNLIQSIAVFLFYILVIIGKTDNLFEKYRDDSFIYIIAFIVFGWSLLLYFYNFDATGLFPFIFIIDISFWNKLLTLLIPILHFIYYFTKALYKRFYVSRKLIKNLKKHKEEFDNCMKDLNSVVSFFNDSNALNDTNFRVE